MSRIQRPRLTAVRQDAKDESCLDRCLDELLNLLFFQILAMSLANVEVARPMHLLSSGPMSRLPVIVNLRYANFYHDFKLVVGARCPSS